MKIQNMKIIINIKSKIMCRHVMLWNTIIGCFWFRINYCFSVCSYLWYCITIHLLKFISLLMFGLTLSFLKMDFVSLIKSFRGFFKIRNKEWQSSLLTNVPVVWYNGFLASCINHLHNATTICNFVNEETSFMMLWGSKVLTPTHT